MESETAESLKHQRLGIIRATIDAKNPEFRGLADWIKDAMVCYYFGRIINDDGTLKQMEPADAAKLADDLKHARATMTIDQRVIRALYMGGLEATRR